MELRRNAIFTTGGGTGIGRALAEALHAKGNNLIISGRRKAADPRAMPLYDFVKETLHALKIAETELLTEKVLAQTCAQLLRSISIKSSLNSGIRCLAVTGIENPFLRGMQSSEPSVIVTSTVSSLFLRNADGPKDPQATAEINDWFMNGNSHLRTRTRPLGFESRSLY